MLVDAVNVVQGTDKAETLIGSAGDDRIFGFGGDDRLVGLDGYNVLIGGAGADTMVGGSGPDSYEVDNKGDVVLDPGGGAVVSAQVSWTATTGSIINVLQTTSAGSIALTGNLHDDSYALSISGGSSIDILSDGGSRSDLSGGFGNDIYIVTDALTQVHEHDGADDFSPGHGPDAPTSPPPSDPLIEGYDSVRTNLATYTLPANVEVLTYFGTENFFGTGNAESNLINGGVGNDTLDGGAGVDRLVGGVGNDTYKVDDARDYVVEQVNGGFDNILSTASSFIAPANVEALTYVGVGSFNGFANAAGTSITGGVGSDFLHGGAGNDTLNGGLHTFFDPPGPDGTYQPSVDTLIGGGGADIFQLYPVSQFGSYRIIDFTPGIDKIDVTDSYTPHGTYEFTTQPPPSDPFEGGHNIVQILFYDQKAGALYVVDGTDYSASEKLVATFDNHPALTSSDFIGFY